MAGGANLNGNTVAQFDVRGGLLSPKSPATVPSGQDPIPAAVDAAGASTYVGNVLDLTVSQYDVGTGGALCPKATPTVNNNGIPSAIALAPADGPQASFSASVSATTASLDASASGPDVARYDWDFGDGTMLSDGGPTPTHAYSGHGPFIATLTVTDATGCGPSGVWIGRQFLCTGDRARTRQVVDIPAPSGPPSPTGATGATGAAGATGPQGEPGTTGTPPAGRLGVALLFDRLRAKRGRTVTMPFASSAFAGIVLSVYHGAHRVARFQQFAHEGRNTVRWHSGRAAAGRYRVVLQVVGLDDQPLARSGVAVAAPTPLGDDEPVAQVEVLAQRAGRLNASVTGYDLQGLAARRRATGTGTPSANSFVAVVQALPAPIQGRPYWRRARRWQVARHPAHRGPRRHPSR